MQNTLKFDIEKKADVKKSFRVSKIMAEYDIKPEHSQEHFTGEIDIPENWNIGVIVGSSGTGKTTIAKELFKEKYFDNFEYKSASVIDDMPKEKSVDEICKAFYSVGFRERSKLVEALRRFK